MIRRTHDELSSMASEIGKNDPTINKTFFGEKTAATKEFEKLTSMRIGSLNTGSWRNRYYNGDIPRDIGDNDL